VIVSLQSDPDQVNLSVQDDGRGFDLNNVAEDKLGIQIMSERAREIGAKLELSSSPQQGTQVSISWVSEEYNQSI
jgi:signal transduction histidine kinase